MIHLVDFPPFFTRETIFVTSSLCSAHLVPSKKGSALKGKKLLPLGSNFFPFRGDPFSKGDKNNFDRVVSLEKYHLPLSFQRLCPNLKL